MDTATNAAHCVSFCVVCISSEQYEAFLKFNYDEISRRFGETAASCKYHQFACVYKYCYYSIRPRPFAVLKLYTFWGYITLGWYHCKETYKKCEELQSWRLKVVLHIYRWSCWFYPNRGMWHIFQQRLFCTYFVSLAISAHKNTVCGAENKNIAGHFYW